MASVLVKVDDQKLLEKLLTFIKDNSLKFEIQEQSGIETLKDDLEKQYIPTEHFKTYLGYEWLTKSGMISKSSVLYFLENHIKLRDIRVVNSIVFPDEWLQKLLEDSRSSFHLAELPQMISKLLT